MKLTILQSKLKEGLEIVEKLAGKNLTLPVLNNVLLSAKKNFLGLATTDLEAGIRWWSLAKIEDEGEITTPTKTLLDAISYFPNKPVFFETKEKFLLVECESYKTQIKYFKGEEFPIIPQIKEITSVSLKSNLISRGLSLVSNVPQLSPSRPEISGIFMSFQKNILKLTATDSFRLAEKKIILDKTAENDFSVIIPQKTIKELVGIIGDKKGELKIYFSPNQIMFELPSEETSSPQFQLFSRLIEGEYPDYESVIPKKYQTQVIVQKNEFLNQARAASVFSGKVNEVKIKAFPKKEKIEISSQSPDLGEYQSSMSSKITGEEAEVSFNYRYLLDGVSSIDSSELILELNGKDGPGVLKPIGDLNYIYVVMPINMA